ncbi:MAG: DUF2000 domain-containing protein [Corynebacteriales bacterium]|nr:DUF2000 domain-containing protein [Mycobacteriales bacterium]
MELPDENEWRFVAVLNKTASIGTLMNALGHMSAGLAAHCPEDMRFLNYADADGQAHPHISHFPFIVLSAKNSQALRRLRNEARERDMVCTDFVETMRIGTTAEQLEATANTAEADHQYLGVCLFGKTHELREITKRFSLFSG